jgi:hypothetical protein
MIAILNDRRNWSRSSIDPTANWYYPLPDSCQALLAESRRQLAGTDKSVWMRSPPESVVRLLRAELRPIREELEQGRGFAIITGLQDFLTVGEKAQTYWLVGYGLGLPVVQNVQGVLLYDVRDTGQDVRQGARFSVTNAESSFHTDNSFGHSLVDYVGLLCLQTACCGGVSQMVNGLRVVEEMAKQAPEQLGVLQREFQFDRRGGIQPGEAPTVRFPVMERRPGDWVCRYLRFWIEAGHEKAGLPLTPAQLRALDELDAVLRAPELRVEFDLRPGEMYFLNNRWIFHNRTAFEDHPELERRRHLVRLWLQA